MSEDVIQAKDASHTTIISRGLYCFYWSLPSIVITTATLNIDQSKSRITSIAMVITIHGKFYEIGHRRGKDLKDIS